MLPGHAKVIEDFGPGMDTASQPSSVVASAFTGVSTLSVEDGFAPHDGFCCRVRAGRCSSPPGDENPWPVPPPLLRLFELGVSLSRRRRLLHDDVGNIVGLALLVGV